MTRRRAVVAGAALLAALAVTAGVLLSRGRDEPPPRSGPAQVRACAHVDEFLAVVRDDGPATDAVAALDRAGEQARAAAAADPQWVALSGAVDALRAALRKDDANAADVGTRVVRTECRKVRGQANAP